MAFTYTPWTPPAEPWRIEDAQGNKVCRSCGLKLPIDQFRVRAGRPQRHVHCKACLDAKVNPSPAAHKARFKYVLRYKYGITPEEYQELDTLQNSRCALCGSPGKAYSRLYVDHCHQTGKVRGLLCNTCNAGLGQFNDNIELVEKALNYLKRGGVR